MTLIWGLLYFHFGLSRPSPSFEFENLNLAEFIRIKSNLILLRIEVTYISHENVVKASE